MTRERVARKTAERQEAQAIVAKVKERVALDLPVTLLSGETKQLRYTTGAELAGLGTAYARLAAAVPPRGYDRRVPH